MLEGRRHIVIVVAALGALCCSARADLTHCPGCPPVTASVSDHTTAQASVGHGARGVPLGAVRTPPWSSLEPDGQAESSVQLNETGRTVKLPGGPGSATLVLPALLGFGAWQIGRSARKLHFGHVPEWYCEHATQVGHATPLSLEFSRAAMPVCIFDAPIVVGTPPCLSGRLPEEPYIRLLSQTILLDADPRGPPALS
jgi:hypothetical protein